MSNENVHPAFKPLMDMLTPKSISYEEAAAFGDPVALGYINSQSLLEERAELMKDIDGAIRNACHAKGMGRSKRGKYSLSIDTRNKIKRVQEIDALIYPSKNLKEEIQKD